MPTTKNLGAAYARARANFALGVVLPILLIWTYRPLVRESIEDTRAEPVKTRAEPVKTEAKEDE